MLTRSTPSRTPPHPEPIKWCSLHKKYGSQIIIITITTLLTPRQTPLHSTTKLLLLLFLLLPALPPSHQPRAAPGTTQHNTPLPACVVVIPYKWHSEAQYFPAGTNYDVNLAPTTAAIPGECSGLRKSGVHYRSIFLHDAAMIIMTRAAVRLILQESGIKTPLGWD